MKMGKQLTMEKRLYENQIMRKALLKELDIIFKNIEYTQRVVESIFSFYSGMSKTETYWRKIGDKLADSKYYFLSATFVVVKGIDEMSKTTLKEHFVAHRPVDALASMSVAPKTLLGAIKNLKELSIEKPQAFNKYKNKKFDEYYGYYIGVLDKIIEDLEKYVIQDN